MGKCLIQYQSLAGCLREQFSTLSCSFFTSMTSTNTTIQKLCFFQMTVYYTEIKVKIRTSTRSSEISCWSHTWQMSFNINKCYTLHDHRKKQPIIHTNTMDNTPVTPDTHHPYLDIELQSDLRWTTQMYTEHNQQSTEDTKHAEKKPQTSLYNCKITGIQNNSKTPT